MDKKPNKSKAKLDSDSPSRDLDDSQLSRDLISALENELRDTKENLRATVEKLETANEELRTVNHEYERKIGELAQLTDDMNNLFQSADAGVIFLDESLNIRRFSPKIGETFELSPQDIGRPIQNFIHNIRDEQVFEDLATALKTEEDFEREVRDQSGDFWLLISLLLRNIAVLHRTDTGESICTIAPR